MPELIAKSPLSGVGAVAHGGLRLSEHLPGPVTSIAVLPGQEKAVARGLKPLGLGFPAPNTFGTAGAATLTITRAAVAAVPEPATWAMMLIGFGAMGVSLRRRRRTDTLFQAA